MDGSLVIFAEMGKDLIYLYYYLFPYTNKNLFPLFVKLLEKERQKPFRLGISAYTSEDPVSRLKPLYHVYLIISCNYDLRFDINIRIPCFSHLMSRKHALICFLYPFGPRLSDVHLPLLIYKDGNRKFS